MFCLKLNAPGLWVSLALSRELFGHTPRFGDWHAGKCGDTILISRRGLAAGVGGRRQHAGQRTRRAYAGVHGG